MKNVVKIQEVDPKFTNRRSFLKISGMGVVGAGLLATMGCSDDDDPIFPVDPQYPGIRNGVFDLGGGDLGILTYAYALEQLEADFYTKVVNASQFNSAFSLEQRTVMTDIYNHEVIHREFFKAAIGGALPNGAALLPDLAFDYGRLNFNDPTTVLATAKALEDTGVAAYNGAGRYLTNPDYLLLAGKIVSVEARHAAAVRTLINFNSVDFAGDDVVDVNTGLDVARKPSQIISEVKALNIIQTNFTAQFLQ